METAPTPLEWSVYHFELSRSHTRPSFPFATHPHPPPSRSCVGSVFPHGTPGVGVVLDPPPLSLRVTVPCRSRNLRLATIILAILSSSPECVGRRSAGCVGSQTPRGVNGLLGKFTGLGYEVGRFKTHK